VDATKNYRKFVVLYNLGIPATEKGTIIQQGFIPRMLSRTIHITKPYEVTDFIRGSIEEIELTAIQMINVQQIILSNHEH
jgi:hypothetical protein